MLRCGIVFTFLLAWNFGTAADLPVSQCFTNTDALFAVLGNPPPCRCFDGGADGTKKTLSCTFAEIPQNNLTNIFQPVQYDVKVLVLSGNMVSTVRPRLHLSYKTFANKAYQEIHITSFGLQNHAHEALGVLEAIRSTLLVLNVTNCNVIAVNLNVQDSTPPPFFWNLENLQRLHLVRINVPELEDPSTVLQGLSSLKTLSLSRSRGPSALSDLLKPVAETLQHLDMSYSCFEKPAVAVALNELTILDLRRSPPAECIDAPFSSWVSSSEFSYARFPKLEYLSLSGDFSESGMTGVTKESASLKHLDLSDTNIELLKKRQFASFTGLNRLVLRRSELSRTETGAFEGRELDILDLSGIRVPDNAQLGEMLAGLSTKTLAITETTLSTMDFSTMSPASPDTLDLRNSPNLNLSRAIFGNRTNLRSLFMSGLPQQDIPEALLDPIKSTLKEMELSRSNITNLPENWFKDAGSLESINLNHNELETVPQSLALVNKLARLDLSGNKLQTLSDNFVHGLAAKLKDVDSLNLGENPWNCTSKMCALYTWVQDKDRGGRVICSNRACPTCASPASTTIINNNNPLNAGCPQATTTSHPGPAATRSSTAASANGDSSVTTTASTTSTKKATDNKNDSARLVMSTLLSTVASAMGLIVLRT